jgi:2',3'-cyclic-nucleotide 2'-phosphodiesterase (5'-nucleotidase family)
MRLKLNIIIFIIGAGLSACSFGKKAFVSSNVLPIDNHYSNSRKVDSIVSPYKVQLDAEMNQVVTFAEVDFVNNKPWGNLGNLVADIILEKGKTFVSDSNVVCLINFGGLRAPLNKGEITLGDIFKVMPFDNQMVLVKMPAGTMEEIRTYLKTSGGEPIAGFTIDDLNIFDSKGKNWSTKEFWVVTSDYLMNGGDRMYFFQKRVETIEPGILFRDVLIEYVQKQAVLKDKQEPRIK